MSEELPDWKVKALELLPELEEQVAEAEGPMAFWIEAKLAFTYAYEEPRRDDFIRRTYEFAWWCLKHSQIDEEGNSTTAENDLPTAVCQAFFENLPLHPAARAGMPRWLERQDVLGLRHFLAYHLGEEEFERMVEAYPVECSHRAAQRLERKQNRQPKPWSRPDHPSNRPYRKH